MPKRDTRAQIAQICHDQVVATSLSAVRVGELIKAAGVNRNTFYYHFSSKYEVAEWIFRRDLAYELRQEIPESQLVYRSRENEPEAFATLPFYARKEIAARTLDHSAFAKGLATCILKDAEFYRKLFTSRETEVADYTKGIWREALLDDVEAILDGRYLPQETKLFLADNAASMLLNTVQFCLANEQRARLLLDDEINPFWNAIPDSLAGIIRKYPVNPKPIRR